MPRQINCSIVVFRHSVEEISALAVALKSSAALNKLFIIDNSPAPNFGFRALADEYIFCGKNLGYGRAHNIALRHSLAENVPFHLVVNPDVSLESSVLDELLQVLQNDEKIGLVMPKVLSPANEIQHLCKRLPAPFDLIIRVLRFEKVFKKRQKFFEMRDFDYEKPMFAPYLSGCFMLLKMSALREVGLFDERFFLYPEDIDLSRRIFEKYKCLYYPNVKIIHKHERASYKSLKIFTIHVWNIVKYFNKWGWIFDFQRRKINKNLTQKR